MKTMSVIAASAGVSMPVSMKGTSMLSNIPETRTLISTPPSTVPSYMGVLVASSITKTGSTISGNTIKIVVVKTDPGYSGNPGHAGTGTIVATYC